MTAGHTGDDERLDGDQLVAAYLGELEREAARLPWNTRMELLEDVRSHIAVVLAESDAGRDAGESNAEDVTAQDATPDDTESDDTAPERVTVGTSTRTAHVRRILSALGEPGEIVDAAAADEPTPVPSPDQPPGYPPSPYSTRYQHPDDPGPPYALGAHEILAIVFLLFGGLLYGLGWIIGAALLWTSPRWNLRARLIGTLFWPGGLGAPVVAFGLVFVDSSMSCYSTPVDGIEHCPGGGSGSFGLSRWIAVPLTILVILAPIVVAFYLARAARARPHPDPWRRRSAGGAALGWVGGVVGVIMVILLGGLLFACAASGTSSKPQPNPPSASYGVPFQSPGAAYSSSGSAPGASFSNAAPAPTPSSPSSP